MKEQWKACLRGYYEVSNLGRIRRAKPGNGTRVGKILTGYFDKDGYLKVSVSIYGKTRYIPVHRLVARKFIGPRPKGMEINHKDLDKSNACSDNLEYITPKGNQQHAADNGVIARGKLTTKKLRKMKKMWNSSKYTVHDLAKKFDIAVANVYRRLNGGKTWKG